YKLAHGFALGAIATLILMDLVDDEVVNPPLHPLRNPLGHRIAAHSVLISLPQLLIAARALAIPLCLGVKVPSDRHEASALGATMRYHLTIPNSLDRPWLLKVMKLRP